VENLSNVAVYGFSTKGGCYGLLIRIRRRAFVLGGNERGIFYRFGAAFTETRNGRYELFFGLKTIVGIAELMIKKWMKNEVVPLKFRPARIRGSLHFSRTGIITFLGGSLAPSSASTSNRQFLPDNYQTDEGNNNNSY
jgi:hypothetical protein